MSRNTSEKADGAIWEKAVDWVLRVDAAPDDAALRAARDAWLLERAEHAAAYRKADQAWSLARDIPPAHEDRWAAGACSASLAAFRPRETSDTGRGRSAGRRAHPALRFAPAALAACLALVFLAPTVQLRLQADYVTGVGRDREVTLADGTTVHLDTASAIGTRFTASGREASLLSGRAFFHVRPDTHRPFSVHAGNTTIVVTGTAFSVGLSPESVLVAVQSGSVRVDDEQGRPIETRLSSGDWLQIDRATAATRRDKTPPSQIAAWRQGRLVVENATIDQVVTELRRYHRGLILIRDKALARNKVTGVYDLHDPAAALRAVVQPYAGSVHELTPYLLVVSGS